MEIFGNLNEQINMLKMQNKMKFEIVASFIFFSKCRKKHALHECPLDNIKIYKICAGSHTTSLPGLKAVYQKDIGVNQAPRGPWQPHQPNMMQYPCAQFQGYAKHNWKTPLPWQPWPSQSQS